MKLNGFVANNCIENMRRNAGAVAGRNPIGDITQKAEDLAGGACNLMGMLRNPFDKFRA